MEVHDEVPGLGVSVPDLALVAVRVVAHLVLLKGEVWTLVPRLCGHCHLVVVVGAIAAQAGAQAGSQGKPRGGQAANGGADGGVVVVVEGAAIVVVVRAGGHAGGPRVVLARPAGRRFSAHVSVIVVTCGPNTDRPFVR